jgi:hypothetical protein
MIDNRWIAIALALGLLVGLTPTASAASDAGAETTVSTSSSIPCEPEGPFTYVCLVLGAAGEVCRQLTGEVCFY